MDSFVSGPFQGSSSLLSRRPCLSSVRRIHPIPVNGCIPQSKRLQTSFQLSSARVMCFITLCFVFITWSALVLSPNSPCPPNDRWSACCLSICRAISEDCSQGHSTCPGAFVFIRPQQDRGSPMPTEAALTSKWTVCPELWDVHVIPAPWELRGERFLQLRSWSPDYVKRRKGKGRSWPFILPVEAVTKIH